MHVSWNSSIRGQAHLPVKRMKKRMSLSKFIFTSFASLVLGICIFSCTDDDGFLFLEQNTTKSGAALDSVITTVKQTLTAAFNGKEGTSSATTGYGLNLLLINQAQDGYAKEYLTICAENQNGTLDITKRDAYASVETVVGINAVETGFYSGAGDGRTLPISDLPTDANGCPKWDGSTYSLKNWDVNSHNRYGGNTSVGGPLQYTPGPGVYTAIQTKSIYNKGTTTNSSGPGDCYLFPDAVCGLNDFLQRGAELIGVKLSSLSKTAQNTLGMIACIFSHDRGAGAMPYLFGINYQVIQDGRASQYVDYSALKSGETSNYLEEIYNDFSSVKDTTNLSPTEIAKFSGSGNYWRCALVMLSKGWRLDDLAYSNVCRLGLNQEGIEIWNKANPKDQVSSATELQAAIKKHSGTLASALNISASECDRVYGTRGGALVYWSRWSNSFGYLYKVSDYKSDVYKNGKGSHIVYCMDNMVTDHVFGACAAGSVIYAKMLQYAGVNVNPTDPKTYMAGLTGAQGPGTGTYKPSNSAFENTLKTYGCDLTKLTLNRYKVLYAAGQMIGTSYRFDGSCHKASVGLKNSFYECSGFVYHAIIDAGIDGVDSSYQKGWGGTASYYNSISTAGDGVLKRVYEAGAYSVDDLLPGDILVRNSHIMIYVGVLHGKIQTLEAMGSSYQPNGFKSRNIQNTISSNRVLRLINY